MNRRSVKLTLDASGKLTSSRDWAIVDEAREDQRSVIADYRQKVW